MHLTLHRRFFCRDRRTEEAQGTDDAHDRAESGIAGFPKRLIGTLAVQAGIPRNLSHAACARDEAKRVELMKDENWPTRLAGLENIDWAKSNKDWENVCIIANSVISNRQARAATKAYIKAKLNMELTDGEKRSIEKQAA